MDLTQGLRRALKPEPDQAEQRDYPAQDQMRNVVAVSLTRLGEEVDRAESVEQADDEKEDGENDR